MSREDYKNEFWFQLRDAIDQMLTSWSYSSISFYDMYMKVVLCCKQYNEQLYADLINHVRTRLGQWTAQLSNVSEDKFIKEFHQALEQYFHALGGIVPIFAYMNR